MTEVSAAQNPGRYRYLFDAPLVAQNYLVLYRHTTDPVGIDSEIHTVLSDIDSTAGANTVTVNVLDEALAGVPGATVDVYDAGGTIHLLRVTDEDLDGTLQFNLNNGDYLLRATGPRFTPDDPELAVTVNGATEVNIDGSVLSPPVAGDPSLCTVSGYITDVAGNMLNGVVLQFYGNAPQGVADNVITATKVEVTSGPIADTPQSGWPNGYIEQDFQRGALVRTKCAVAKFDNLILTIPAAGSALLSDLVETARGA
jgi:hypothetical protein